MTRMLLAVLATELMIQAVAVGKDHPDQPTSAYSAELIEEFRVLFHPDVFANQIDGKVRQELARQLVEIRKSLPEKPYQALKQVPIWVEWNNKPNGGAEFHPSAEWLKANNYNPEKRGAIEISNCRNFLDWSRRTQPSMMLHELAHAYHFLVIGGNDAGIRETYRQAVDRHLYDEVAFVTGGRRKAYAITNDKEYFAELTEAYFGKNDFFPFVRSDLEAYDPVGYRLIQSKWNMAP